MPYPEPTARHYLEWAGHDPGERPAGDPACPDCEGRGWDPMGDPCVRCHPPADGTPHETATEVTKGDPF